MITTNAPRDVLDRLVDREQFVTLVAEQGLLADVTHPDAMVQPRGQSHHAVVARRRKATAAAGPVAAVQSALEGVLSSLAEPSAASLLGVSSP
jgi:hypothetical protein